MNPEAIEYVKRRLSRTEETLEDAELLLRKGHLNGAVNRLYYACFYAVTALLYTEGYSSSKHSGVKSLFDLHWMKTERLPGDLGKFYRQLFNDRQEGDYQDTVFEAVDVERWLKKARDFVDIVSAKARESI
ncbi:MAG: HEPN domain-containing protein [Armatimonadetes bacterium]|nr:HEPN domain-containing protein [Armatimonadota bacterium]